MSDFLVRSKDTGYKNRVEIELFDIQNYYTSK